MPLPSSGPLSLNDIQTEFGGTNPISLNEYYAGGGRVPAGTTGTYGAVPSSGTISIQNFYGTSNIVVGQVAYTAQGTYSWVAPAGVTSVSAVAVGGGRGGGIFGGQGGFLRYKNNISVVAGSSYTVVVGPGGYASCGCNFGGLGQLSSFINNCTLVARGGGSSAPNVGCGTGSGGAGVYGGGGAAGYSGNGGAGGCSGANGAAGAGGGGGGGGGSTIFVCCCFLITSQGGGGGGVGLLGAGSNGAGGTHVAFGNSTGGGGGSGGAAGGTAIYGNTCVCGTGGSGGAYGGGGGSGWRNPCAGEYGPGGIGGSGAVRIIWPGSTRSFPSTCTGNL